jgi:hypothetical protein
VLSRGRSYVERHREIPGRRRRDSVRAASLDEEGAMTSLTDDEITTVPTDGRRLEPQADADGDDTDTTDGDADDTDADDADADDTDAA